MRKRLKLSFDRLEDTLTLVSPIEASSVLGGYSGSMSLPENASVDDILNYYSGLGFTFAQDENGNYSMTGGGSYEGPGIKIDAVTVMGTAYNHEEDGSENRYAMALYDILSAYAIDTGGLGSDGSYGNGGGQTGSFDPGPAGGADIGGPWRRDASGKVIATPTTRTAKRDYTSSNQLDKVTLYFEEVIIRDKDLKTVTAYRVTKYTYVDENNNLVTSTDIPDRYKANCHGNALGVDLWFNDFPDSDITNSVGIAEDKDFQEMMTKLTSTAEDATAISFYNGSILAHTLRIDPASGVVWSKTDHGEVVLYDSLQDFYNAPTANDPTRTNGTIYSNLTKKYYNTLSD